MKLFYLERKIDVSGTSGVGRVAEGVEFDDGTCALRWISKQCPNSTAVYNSVEDIETIHGHGGVTTIVYIKN
jgi:hypothetical protein